MNFVRYILFISVLSVMAAGSALAQGTYEYVDDFSTDQAQHDCYVSSIFWPSDISNPPSRPYLSYYGVGNARGLLFMDHRGERAQLGYALLVGTTTTGGSLAGTLRLDVSFPCNAAISQFPPGQLTCSTSPDGATWSTPVPLLAGHHDIPIPAAQDTFCVLFTGTRAVIDNLRVSLGAPGATLRVPASSATLQDPDRTTPSILHVDAWTGRDWNSGRSRASALATIQAGIDAARSGDTVIVWPGVYEEEIHFKGKAITVQSAGDAALITAPAGYAVSFYNAEGSKSILANFVIAGCGEGGIFCDFGSSPTLRNLTITANQAGVAAYGGANPYLVNCILWNNSGRSLPASKANYTWRAYYSCIDQPNPSKAAGNINADPKFADPLNGDFHLKSPWGRYVPWANTWVLDGVPSPCLDAGDPTDGPCAERVANGTRINMGAYGGTPFASHSSGPACP